MNGRVAPFLERFVPRIRDGSKTMTCRNYRLGEPGDTLRVFVNRNDAGFSIYLTTVYPVRLGIVASQFWKDEGCESEADFIAIWKQIHKGAYSSSRTVWAHRFRLAREGL